MRSYPCKVVGITYSGRIDYILTNVGEGENLDLLAEPDNTHDDRAVAVYHNGYKIGYIPSDKKWVWKSISEGDIHQTTAVGLVLDEKSNITAVAIEITILSDGDNVADQRSKSTEVRTTPTAARGVLFIVLAAITIFVLTALFHQSDTGTTVCPQINSQKSAVLAHWKGIGLITDARPDRITVNESRWRSVGNDARVSVAVATFCTAFPGGKGLTLIRSDENDQVLMTVKDGNVFD